VLDLRDRVRAVLRRSGTNDDFNEQDYLDAYPDVAAAVQAGLFKNAREHYLRHGRTEGRLASGVFNGQSRQRAGFHLIDRGGQGLEIGASINPLAPKKRGYKVHILDHATADELRVKYAAEGQLTSAIETVDFVWRGEPLTELIGQTACYDWIIASHVIEHIPDPVSFLQQCRLLLKPGGILSLVVPDKRYCFDYFRPLSSTGDLLDAYAEKRKRPTHGQVFDYHADRASRKGAIAWGTGNSGEPDGLVHALSEAVEAYRTSLEADAYMDVHCWRFTPESFRLIHSDLVPLGLVDLEIKAEFPTRGCEFYVSLGPGTGAAVELPDRLVALKGIVAS